MTIIWNLWVFAISARGGLTDEEAARIAAGWALVFLAVGIALAATWIQAKMGEKGE